MSWEFGRRRTSRGVAASPIRCETKVSRRPTPFAPAWVILPSSRRISATAPRMRASTKAATRRDEDQLVQRAIAVLERRMFRRGQELLSPRGLRQYLRLRLVGKARRCLPPCFSTPNGARCSAAQSMRRQCMRAWWSSARFGTMRSASSSRTTIHQAWPPRAKPILLPLGS